MQPTGRLNFCTALLITLTLTPAVNAAPLWLDCTVHDNPHQMMLLVAGDQCLFRYGAIRPGKASGSSPGHCPCLTRASCGST